MQTKEPRNQKKSPREKKFRTEAVSTREGVSYREMILLNSSCYGKPVKPTVTGSIIDSEG
jgi:hypothetical protein